MPENLAYKDEILSESDVFLNDVLDGLSAEPKSLPCKYFYDQRGSQLFRQICETPEYYITRTETALLKQILPEIAQRLGSGCDIVEFGSGAGEKVRLLLDALVEPASYTPMDISEDALLKSVAELRACYPHIPIHPWLGDYTEELTRNLDSLEGLSRQVVFFPGSTISNFAIEEARAFLSRISQWLGQGGVLLIGVDTLKSESVINRAYNDADGYTAAFNMNLLHRIRDELSVPLNLENFYHNAFFNSEMGRLEMHLVSRVFQPVEIAGRTFEFEEGESIHTENSYKYRVSDFQRMAESVGLHAKKSWEDQDQLFSFHYLVREA